MAERSPLDHDTFLRMAKDSGLDVGDAQHMEALHGFVQGVLPNVTAVWEFNVTDAEPAMIFIPSKE